MSRHYQYRHRFEELFAVLFGQTEASAVEDFHTQLQHIKTTINIQYQYNLTVFHQSIIFRRFTYEVTAKSAERVKGSEDTPENGSIFCVTNRT